MVRLAIARIELFFNAHGSLRRAGTAPENIAGYEAPNLKLFLKRLPIP